MENQELSKDFEELSDKELKHLFADFEYEKEGEGYVLTGVKHRNSAVDVRIPYGVVRIAANAFRLCNNLRIIRIPETLKKFDTNAFWECPALVQVHIDSVSSWCESVFEGEWSNPLKYSQTLFVGGVCANNLVIPDTVTEIPDEAFSGCICLHELTVCGGTRIGKNAFSECRYLTKAVIGPGVTYIDEEAFRGCEVLGTVTLPEGLEVIARSAFIHCYNLTAIDIPESVTEIGSSAFKGCAHLAELGIGKGVRQIGSTVFEDCYSLERVNISDLASWCKIRFVIDGDDTASPVYYSKGLYLNGEPLTDAVIPDGAEEIGERAFFNNKLLKSITIPPSVKRIGDDAFLECENLKRVNLTDLAVWCGIEFVGLTWSNPLDGAEGLYINGELITEAKVPEGASEVKASAFYGYKALKSISLPEGVKVIREFAFRNCTGLTEITLPRSLEKIEARAFEGAEGVNTVRFRGSKKEWKRVDIESVFKYLSYDGKKTLKEKTNRAILKAKVTFDFKD